MCWSLKVLVFLLKWYAWSWKCVWILWSPCISMLCQNTYICKQTVKNQTLTYSLVTISSPQALYVQLAGSSPCLTRTFQIHLAQKMSREYSLTKTTATLEALPTNKCHGWECISGQAYWPRPIRCTSTDVASGSVFLREYLQKLTLFSSLGPPQWNTAELFHQLPLLAISSKAGCFYYVSSHFSRSASKNKMQRKADFMWNFAHFWRETRKMRWSSSRNAYLPSTVYLEPFMEQIAVG